MKDAGDLSLAPALLDVQGADEVGPFLTAEGDQRRAQAADRTESRAAEIRAVARSAALVLAWILRRDRRREAAAEGCGVGKQVRLVEALAVGRDEVRPVVAAAGEREERLRLTGGDARPGQIAGVEVDGVDGVEPVARFSIDVEMSDQGAVGGVRGDVEPEVGADRPAELDCD